MKLNPCKEEEADLEPSPAEWDVSHRLADKSLSLEGLQSVFVKEGIEPFHAAMAISKKMKDFFEGKPKSEAYKGTYAKKTSVGWTMVTFFSTSSSSVGGFSQKPGGKRPPFTGAPLPPLSFQSLDPSQDAFNEVGLVTTLK